MTCKHFRLLFIAAFFTVSVGGMRGKAQTRRDSSSRPVRFGVARCGAHARLGVPMRWQECRAAGHVLHGFGRRRRLEDRERRPHLVPDLPMRAFPSAPSAPSPSRLRIRISFTSALASPTSAASTPTASACSSRPTPARPGPTSASTTASTSAASWWIRQNPNRVYRRRARPRLRRQPRARRLSLDRRRRAPGRRCSSRRPIRTTSAPSISRIDPKNPRMLYASLWATRRPPWSVYAPSNMPGGGLYKSTDGGDHLEATDRRLARRSLRGQDRHRRRAQQSEPSLGRGRRYRQQPSLPLVPARRVSRRRERAERRRRRLRLRRCRRHLAAGQSRTACGDAAGTSNRSPSIPTNPDRAYVINTGHLS